MKIAELQQKIKTVEWLLGKNLEWFRNNEISQEFFDRWWHKLNEIEEKILESYASDQERETVVQFVFDNYIMGKDEIRKLFDQWKKDR